jgi:hypothetical protein
MLNLIIAHSKWAKPSYILLQAHHTYHASLRRGAPIQVLYVVERGDLAATIPELVPTTNNLMTCIQDACPRTVSLRSQFFVELTC